MVPMTFSSSGPAADGVTVVAARPDDPSAIPFSPLCKHCAGLRDDPHPGLSTWVMAVAQHLENIHHIRLVGD